MTEPTSPKVPTVEDWIAALESDRYTQCTTALHVEGIGFCCLGVLCDLAGATWIEYSYGPKDHKAALLPAGLGSLHHKGSLLSKEAPGSIPWKLVEAVTGKDSVQWDPHPLAVMNDEGKTFKEIAAVIRAQLLTPES